MEIQSENKVYAKSPENGGLTILEHTKYVVEAIKSFAIAYGFDAEIAKNGAILHDLGKAHPYFQKSIRKQIRDVDRINHRHEISSLAFLPAFPKKQWDDLIDMVVAHHKSIKEDARKKGILDISTNDRNWIKNHLDDWGNWKKYGFEVLNQFGINIDDISENEAKKALIYSKEYCKSKGFGISRFRGLLNSADHFASAFNERTKENLNGIFQKPNISFFKNPQRKSKLYPLSSIDTNDSRSHTIVTAPTGAGKTDFLIKRCKGRIFYTLPFQASINAMWQRLSDDIGENKKHIRLLHSTSKIVTKGKVDEQILQPLPGSSVKVLTPHQLSAIIFGTKGFEAVMLDLEGSDIILDEIHTYSDYAQAMVIEIVKSLLKLNCRIHIGTATMPSVLYDKLLEILGGNKEVFEVQLSDIQLQSFNRHLIQKISKDDVNKIIQESIEKKEKLLIVVNTVKSAQTLFEEISKGFENIEKMLIHSRFRRKDRVELERILKDEFNGTDDNEGHKPCIVISTQVVEVSLDISFDRMITEAAPLDSLIQRFGRVNRKRSIETIGKFKPIHVIAPGTNTLPYEKEIVQRSFAELPEHFELFEENEVQSKLDKVYSKIDMKNIDIHLIYDDIGYKIEELRNKKGSVIIDALEIESATCILAADKEVYLKADWEERIGYEIPISFKSIRWKINKFEQLECGSNPFVIHQEIDRYKEVGLELTEIDNFL